MDVMWMLELEPMDRRAMLRDLDAAIERARAERDPRYLDDCLTGWERISHTLQGDRESQQSSPR